MFLQLMRYIDEGARKTIIALITNMRILLK